jgi:signal transduction histidine kinase
MALPPLLRKAESGKPIRDHGEAAMPFVHRIGTSHAGLSIALLVAACLVVAWLRTGQGEQPRTTRGRLREFGWCAGLVLIAARMMSLFPGLENRDFIRVAVIPLAAGAVVAWRPRLAARILPVLLMLFGLYGFVVARDTNFWSPGETYGVAVAGGANMGLYLVLPQAYASLLLGGWLFWRGLGRRPELAGRVLGETADADRRGQLLGLLLLPVTIAVAALISPNLWLGAGVGAVFWTVVLIGGALQVIRRSPHVAAALATMGIIGLGLAGLYVADRWNAGGWQLRTPNGYVLYGSVDVSSQSMAYAAAVEALAFIGLGCWLLPQALPSVRSLLSRIPDAELTRRVQRLTESRAVAVDTAAADLRRLERDLHDGAQARLVALGMSLRAAERLIPTSPEAAVALVAEARETSVKALTELRELVRGVLPPVLADRGLADAIRALALDCPLRVATDIDLPGQLPAPVETACYFAVAEVLTNAAKHSGARDARISMSHSAGMLRIEVTDFGLGGADPAGGSGLAGVEKRLVTFDGILAISSPPGGPTMVVMEVPCALSSLKISSC